MDYEKRIKKLRNCMEKRNLNAILVAPDASWEYLTGIPRMGSGNTKQRQNSLEYSCLLVTENDIVAFLPKLSYIVAIAKLEDKKVSAEFVIYEDGDLTGKALNETLIKLKLNSKTVGVTQDISASLVLKLQDQLDIKVVDATDIILSMRSVKDEEELNIMREAALITDRIYNTLVPKLHIGVSVREMEFEIDKLIEKFGASKSSFPSEVNTHGPKSGDMVGFSYHTIEKGYVLGLDYGVVYKGYCTDFGRTIFVGEPTKEFVKMYNLIHTAQQTSMEMFKKGVSTGHEINCNARSIIEGGGYGEHFIHKLGHSIGMDVHERPFLAKGEHNKHEVGMVYAMEPSIFIPHCCFIRLEDQVLVTDTGYECFSKISKDIVVID